MTLHGSNSNPLYSHYASNVCFPSIIDYSIRTGEWCACLHRAAFHYGLFYLNREVTPLFEQGRGGPVRVAHPSIITISSRFLTHFYYGMAILRWRWNEEGCNLLIFLSFALLFFFTVLIKNYYSNLCFVLPNGRDY